MKKFLFLLGILIMTTMSFTRCDNANSGNPLLNEWHTPFGVPPFDLIEAKHYMPAIEAALKEHEEEIRKIVHSNEVPDFQNVILAFDDSGELLDRVITMMSLIGAANTTPELQEVREQATPVITAHYDEILMNKRLFEKIEAVYLARHNSGLRPLQIRLTEKTYDKFVRAGAKLHDVDKATLKQINVELSNASFRFGKNLLEETANFVLWIEQDTDLDGLPNNVKYAAAELATELGQKGKWAFTLSKPSMMPFLTYSSRADLRETIYTAYMNRCNNGDSLDNNAVVKDIVKLRAERAHLLGYTSHASYVLAQNMAKTPEAVYSLLDDLWTPSLEAAASELAELQELKRSEGGGDTIYSWDWFYYSEKLRKNKYRLDQEELRSYFSADNVRSGIFLLTNRLYGIAFRPIPAPVYSDDCIVYEALDSDGSHLGVLYLDLYAREGRKDGGAWCATYRPQSYRDGERIAPIVTIVCNFPRPTKNTPSLLSLDDVETFFHEFGHALHALFSNVPYKGLLEVENDFVELPSQVMENWAFDPQMLSAYAVHYNARANSPNKGIIPENLIKSINDSKYFNQGFMLTELIAAAYLDMDIHTLKDGAVENLQLFEQERLNDKRHLMPQIPPRYRYTYFAHIFAGGYSAGYYSYLWSEVLDKDTFEAFLEKRDIFNKKIADRFRKQILSRGSSEDGMTLYRNFRGAEPNREALLRGRGIIAPISEPEEKEVYEEDIDTEELLRMLNQ